MSRPLPDTLVIGGGLIGCLCAYGLARCGRRVMVVERGELERESSWAGAGILSPIQPWLYPDALSELVNRSLARYASLVPELMEQGGSDPQWRRCGMLAPATAEIIARVMNGESPGIDLAPFAVDRAVAENHPLALPA